MAGVQPSHYREAGLEHGVRAWCCLLLLPSARGGPFKEMTYKNHNGNTSKVMMSEGVPDWASKTHICRRSAAQRGTEAGASESDNKRQGLRSHGMALGAYEAPIPNMWMTLVLSGGSLTCTALSTPRLKLEATETQQARLSVGKIAKKRRTLGATKEEGSQ